MHNYLYMQKTKQLIKCQLCGTECASVGLSSHLRFKHNNMLVNEYISQFGDFRINSAKAKGNQIGKDLVKCKLCNDGCDYTTTAFSFHLKKKHNLVKEEYILTHLLNGEQPKCKCGCGNSTTIKSYFLPYTTEYISGHNKSTLGYKFSDDSISKMKAKAISRTEQFRANGETAPWHSKEALEKRGKNFHNKSIGLKESRYNVTVLSETGSKIEFSCNQCDSVYSQYHSSYFTCLKCNPPKKSKMQCEVYDYIKKELDVSDAIMDHRKTFSGNMEVDIFVPSKSIGIEFDGLYYHSEVAGNKPKTYHAWKTNECDSKGIRLIHIFEDEWRDQQEIVKSKIKKLLSHSVGIEKIYARKCEVRPIGWNDAKQFLDKNHIQGSVPASILLGLFFNNSLVSVATFGKPTIVRGKKSLLQGEWELMRMATDIKKNVIGAAGKLLSFFIKTHVPIKIISYADKRFTSKHSNVYASTGFSLVSDGQPNYYYMNNYKNRLHRFNFTKSKLVESGADPMKTEWQIMQDLGYDRIWDCGHLKYELNISQNSI